MNEIVNKLLLEGYKFMPEMHLRQPGFFYSTCGPFTKNKERIQKFKETGDTNYIYKNELDKACFEHDMAYGDFKDLTKRTAADKVLRDNLTKYGLTKEVNFKKWLRDNSIEMYSIHNEGKSVVAEKLIRTRKNKIYKYMTSISKNVYIDKLDDIVKKYNNTYHTSIKIKTC